MDSHDPYAKHWRAVRRRYYVFIVTFLGFIPTGVLAETLEARVSPGHKTIQNIAFVAYSLCLVVVFAWAKRVVCPRCRELFTAKGIGYNDFALRCLHCGLPRGATLAEVESGTYLVPEFSWTRVFRLVLAGVEILIGIVCLGLWLKFGSPLPGASGPLWITGGIAFFLSSTALMLRTRSCWWLQLLPVGWMLFVYLGRMR